jgi:predicted dehydrogenase
MKIVIAGLGSIGRRHLRNLTSLGESELLLLRTHRSTLPDADLVGIPSVTDLAEALAWKPDAVIVSNPTSLHLDIAIPAARAGCHLLIEKPISHSLEGIDQLQEAVAQGGGEVLVGYQFRFHPNLKKIKELLSTPDVKPSFGKALSARACWSEWLPGWHPWEDYRTGYSARSNLGGGVILTLSHPLDYLSWLFGEVAEVWAFANTLGDLQIDVEDTAEIGLKFKNGLIASVHLDYNGQPSEHNLEIIGTQGKLLWDNQQGAIAGAVAGDLALYQKESNRNAGSADWEIYPAPAKFGRNDLFMAEIQHFLSLINGETHSACTLEDGIHSLKIALAALRSAQDGQIQRL